MTLVEIRAEITRAAIEIFETEHTQNIAARLKNDAFKLTDLSDSSLKLVEFCMELEEKLNVSLEFSDITDNSEIANFTALLHRRA